MITPKSDHTAHPSSVEIRMELGAGRADYKTHFCKSSELRFDSYVPCSLHGHALAVAFRAANAVKRPLKTNDTLMNAFAAVRRRAPN